MKGAVRVVFDLWPGLAIAVGICLASKAAAADSPTVASNTLASAAAAASLPPEPPLFPPKSPVDLFRDLLAATPAERNALLKDRSPESRERILAKWREYKSMKPDVRELRLRATDLRWYLLPLLNQPATNRAWQLEQVPEASRQLVADRLREWDQLPTSAQKALLKNEATLQFLTEEQRRKVPDDISPARREKLEQGIAQWRTLSDEERRQIAIRFNRFFELNAAEQQNALTTLSEPERRQLEKTLHSYKDLSPSQRVECIRSFQKFAGMTIEERQQFLKNAERWKLMSPDERQAWRELVNQMQLLPPDNITPPEPRSVPQPKRPVVANSSTGAPPSNK